MSKFKVGDVLHIFTEQESYPNEECWEKVTILQVLEKKSDTQWYLIHSDREGDDYSVYEEHIFDDIRCRGSAFAHYLTNPPIGILPLTERDIKTVTDTLTEDERESFNSFIKNAKLESIRAEIASEKEKHEATIKRLEKKLERFMHNE